MTKMSKVKHSDDVWRRTNENNVTENKRPEITLTDEQKSRQRRMSDIRFDKLYPIEEDIF